MSQVADQIIGRYIMTAHLIVSSTNPFVDNIKDGFLFNDSGHEKSHKTKHSKTSVDHFSFLGEAKLEGRQVSVSSLVVDGLHFFVARVVGVNQQTITERRRADGSHQGNSEKVNIGNQDKGTLVGDGGLARDNGQGTPFLQVQSHVRVGDQSVSLAVGSGTDEEPSDWSTK